MRPIASYRPRRGHRVDRKGRSSFRRARRGVSDVVATILLLALTVTLFASIFAFVTSFPSPPAQNSNTFQASLTYTANQSYVSALTILHLAGPAVAGNGLVYLKSANHPAASEFQNPIPVSWGLKNVTATWNLGQTWIWKFPASTLPILPDNITVYVVSGSLLLYSVVLPGQIIGVPPTIVSSGVTPVAPTVGASFTVWAVISGSPSANSVYVNLAGVPGLTSTPQKMTLNSQGQWQLVVTSSVGITTTNGTFFAFVNASNSKGTASGAIPISLVLSGSGPLSVAVILVPAPPNAGSTESVQAVVTYTGGIQNAALTVTFSATSTPSGYSFAGSGPSGLTISGPSSVTVVSQSTWTIPSPSSLYTYVVSANAVVAGVGSVTGTNSFEPALIAVSPASGLVGSTVTVTGSAFSTVSGSTVTLSVGAVAVTPSSCSSGTLSGSTITPTGAGGFVCTIAIPSGAPSGATTVVGTDAFSGQSDSAAYTVTAWTISPLSPTSGLLGSSVTVTGSGFGSSSQVTLAFDGIAVTVSSCSSGTAGASITTTAGGGFVCVFKVPYGATAGAGSLVATDTTYPGQTASAPFTVTAWTITLSPTSYAHGIGGSVTITGVGFAGSSIVSITYNGAVITPVCTSGTVSGNQITATAAGGFVCTYTVAAGSAGVYAFVANDATSGQTASAFFRLT
jgi:flagellin-like protein